MQHYDVSIIGGGLVGGVLAIALAKQGLTSIVIDKEPPTTLINPELDGRTTAVCYSSQQLFTALGLWDAIAPSAEPIYDIKVFEGNSPWSIHFDHQEIGKEPMGYITENPVLRQAIYDKAQSYHDLITWAAPCEVITKKVTARGVILYLSNGEEVFSPLYVGAEGRHSKSREAADINVKEFDYQQKGLVFSVYHDRPHQNIAWEVFYPSGPMAFLPIKDCPETGRHRSGVVWTLPTAEADDIFAASNEVIAAKLTELFSHLGVIELIGNKWCYPLTAQMVDSYIDKRMVIIGDAAHVCHPVAGQGVNLGWRDAAVLSHTLAQAKSLGSDLGSLSLLQEYQRQRRLDTWSLFAMTHSMVKLFSNNSSILHFLRNTGLAAVNQISPLKRAFMRQAMGLGGNIPPHLQGLKEYEPLNVTENPLS